MTQRMPDQTALPAGPASGACDCWPRKPEFGGGRGRG